MNYDSILNEEQLAPLKDTEGAILVTAGAGSGKTRLLTHRVAYLIEEKGVSPYEILAITFTNKAAGEMSNRISNMVAGANHVWISTFHSMCAKILRIDIAHMPPFTKDYSIYSESDSDKAIKEVLAENGENDDKLKKALTFHLSNWKNGTMSLKNYLLAHKDDFGMNKIGRYMMAYQDKLKKNNALDFDDLIFKTVELFKTCPEVLEHYANRFKYICVDEFQDTNLAQYELVKLLSSVHKNVFVVGDEDQCIYSWRGANFQNIFNFKKDFEPVKVYKLEHNYRSSPEIIRVANNVIKNNKTRLNKNMWTTKPSGECPSLYNAYDEREEALFVARSINKLKSQGYEYDDIAVLMRINALSRNLEEAFLSYNIPHRIYGGFKFYERVEIKNIISYLRIFVNPKDDVSFARIINFPKRGIGDGTLAKLAQIDEKNSLLENCLSDKLEGSSLFKKFKDFKDSYLLCKDEGSISDFVENVIVNFRIRECYNKKDEEDLNRLLNIEQFVSSVKEYEVLNPDASISDYLQNITLSSENDEIGQGGAVTIATVHAVKGLEFKAVFIVGLEEGIFPISRALNSDGELEEERRLLYVALTRAEERLQLSYASKRYLYRESQFQTPSRFCRELGLLNLSEKKVKFEKREQGNNFDKYKMFVNKNFEKKEEKSPTKDVSIYKIGQTVSHPRFGEGTIVDISPDGLVGDIVFPLGKKSLMLELAPLQIIEE